MAGKKREERERAGRVVASAVTAVTAVILLYAGNKCAPLTHASAIALAIRLHPPFLSLSSSASLMLFLSLSLTGYPYLVLRVSLTAYCSGTSFTRGKKSGLHTIP